MDRIVDFPEGVSRNISMTDYHKDPAYSKSDMVNAARSTKYVKQMREKKDEPSAAMLIGSATHLLLLEPEKADNEFYITDCSIRRGKKWEEEKLEHEGKIIVTQSEFDNIEQMVESVSHHPIAAPLLTGGFAEVSCKTFIAVDPEIDDSKQLCVKCRPDYLRTQANCIIDLKTARDVTPEGFGRAAYNYKYHWSAFLSCVILEGITGMSHKYYFIAVENKYPFETVVYLANHVDLGIAEAEMSPILMDLATATEKNQFEPIAADKVLDLQLPTWANRAAMVPDF